MMLAVRLAVVVPCFQAERHVERVIRSLPPWVAHIVAVDDGSRDRTGELLGRLADEEPRLRVLRHPGNRGVGAAMATGYGEALSLGADVVVKVDADGQMDPACLPDLVQPLVEGRAEYAKGNRFRHSEGFAAMPGTRLLGNIALTFLTKLASGCWHVFDVQNGYVAITRQALAALPLDRMERGYCFENWMLTWVSILGFGVIDVPVPARYGDEVSRLRVGQALLSFPVKLLRLLLRRLVLKYVVFDFSPIAVYLATGFALLAFAVLFGGYHWWRTAVTHVPTLTGTIALTMLPLLMSFSLLLHAVDLDIRNSPRPQTPRQVVSLEDVIAALERGAALKGPATGESAR